MSIAKKRMFPQSKSKQQLLSNLEKLKKFKPLIKQSIDVFEKPRKSLNRAQFELEDMRSPGEGSQEKPEVITEEDASNYNTCNSYDDFMEIEKKIRKSIQIDHLRGLVGKKGKTGKKRKARKPQIKKEDDYVGKCPDNWRRNCGTHDWTPHEEQKNGQETGNAQPTHSKESAPENEEANYQRSRPFGG